MKTPEQAGLTAREEGTDENGPRDPLGHEEVRSTDEAPLGAVVVAEPTPAWCDSMTRSLLQLGQPALPLPPATAGAGTPTVLEQIATQLVRKAGLGASSVHLRFRAGKLDGGELLVQSKAEGLDIRITPPAGVDGAELASAISERLARRGLRVSQIVVD
jgi:hypothetical protein